MNINVIGYHISKLSVTTVQDFIIEWDHRLQIDINPQNGPQLLQWFQSHYGLETQITKLLTEMGIIDGKTEPLPEKQLTKISRQISEAYENNKDFIRNTAITWNSIRGNQSKTSISPSLIKTPQQLEQWLRDHICFQKEFFENFLDQKTQQTFC